ncbi:MAG: hypothetical protein ACLFVU_04730 [Phycisphaerae bacterium]
MNARLILPALLAGMLLVTVSAAWADEPASSPDPLLEAATKYVKQSDRYMHQSRLKHGMTGYGLTVMHGTKVVRFNATIESVMNDWAPHQDVILARLKGQELETSKVIAGMSGSPVYIKDPEDGKYKMIGAVAYGWSAQAEPLCGIQPINQMLAIRGMLPGSKPDEKASSPASAAMTAGQSRKFLKALVNPEQVDFASLMLAGRGARARSAKGKLVPLSSPLMMAGASPKTLAIARKELTPLGLLPVQTGGAATKEATGAEKMDFAPGSAIGLPYATGDVNYSAVGTVTDVFDGKLVAFGHMASAEGQTAIPMGPAYIHTVVKGVMESFKLGATIKATGTLVRDEQTAVGGIIGRQADTIPMAVSVTFKGDRGRQKTRFQIAKHRWLTAVISRYLLMDSAWNWKELPEYHVVRHKVTVDYGKLGTYSTEDVSANNNIDPVLSDLSRPIGALMFNPVGKPVFPKRIDVEMVIEDADQTATLEKVELNGAVFKPGDKLTGSATLQLFRKDRQRVGFSFQLPDDLEEGTYKLLATNGVAAAQLRTQARPHLYDPKTTEQLLSTVQRVVKTSGNRLYLAVPLQKGGVAIGEKELPQLPGSRRQLLGSANLLDAKAYSAIVEESKPLDYVLDGSAEVTFEVKKDPKQTRVTK